MSIAAILSTKGADVWALPAGARVRDAVELLAAHRIGAAPVIADEGIAGIFSERDLVRCLADHGEQALDWPIERLMSSPALSVDLETPVLTALALMTKRRIRHLPVVESGQIRGIVSIGDLVKYRIERIEAEADAMREYIRSA
jgi:CBS domain-containing protein